jgi:ubiquinone/menaquinone biosynthesis C-methylase UbiE
LSIDQRAKLNSTTEMITKPPTILEPRQAYDLIAPFYEQWKWFGFWRLNEGPIVRQWLKSLKPGWGLDAGSGTGAYIPDIVEFGHNCVAVDISWNMLMQNKTQGFPHSSASITYLQGDISALPFGEKTFDWILCSRVLSHIERIDNVLEEFTRVLKKEGECLICDVHPDHPYSVVAVPQNGEKVAIETYKHSIKSLRQKVSQIPAIQLSTLDEYHLNDLRWKPPPSTFGKLYRHINPAIFYVLKLKKR